MLLKSEIIQLEILIRESVIRQSSMWESRESVVGCNLVAPRFANCAPDMFGIPEFLAGQLASVLAK